MGRCTLCVRTNSDSRRPKWESVTDLTVLDGTDPAPDPFDSVRTEKGVGQEVGWRLSLGTLTNCEIRLYETHGPSPHPLSDLDRLCVGGRPVGGLRDTTNWDLVRDGFLRWFTRTDGD